MPFLAQACVEHGQVAQTGVCCESLTPWSYDAATGIAYDGFGCWNATCAQAGQWAGPGGIGNRCCEGLTNVNGKCGTAVPGGSVPPPVDTGDESGFFGIPTEYLMYGAIAVVAMLMLGGKKK